jgi:hypothetical protein
VNRSFVRKVVYLVAMALLLIPLSLLSQPEAVGTSGARQSPGGALAQYRFDHGLAQSRLGEIDPASETIKLATLGMRGVAANILWDKAVEYQKKEDWTNLSATLEQISKLEPNFINVWRFQAWNLSYNVSVEWDDYRQRYAWVIKGTKFLEEGMKYNENEPLLPWDIGWVIGHKIGTADEKKQYRILFRNDDDYHGSRPIAQRDNWLVGKESFLTAQQIVDTRDVPVRGTSPVIFHSGPAKWQTNYGAGLEIDGGVDGRAVFGEVAQRAWSTAVREWEEFSTRDIPSSLGIPIRLGDLEKHEAEVEKLTKQLDALEPGLREKLVAEKKAKLPEEELKALETKPEDRTTEQSEKAGAAEAKTKVTNQELADRVDEKDRAEARKLAAEIARLEDIIRVTKSNADTIQFKYWYTRCLAERTPEALEARKKMYEANQAYLVDTDLPAARKAYEESFVQWKKVFDAFPLLMRDRVISDDLVGPDYLPGAVRHYEKLLGQIGEKWPEDFILAEFLKHAAPDPPIGQ